MIYHAISSGKPTINGFVFQHYWSSVDNLLTENRTKERKIQRRALNVCREAWRNIPDDYLKKLQKAASEISGSLDLYKRAFCLTYLNMQIYNCTIEKLLHLFPIFLAKYKEISRCLRLLYSSIFLCDLQEWWFYSNPAPLYFCKNRSISTAMDTCD